MTDTLVPPQTGEGLPAPVSAGRRSPRRSARWRLVVCLAIVVGALAWVAVRGLTGSFVYYLTPTDITVDHQAQVDQRVRLGGYVVPGSVHRPTSTLTFTMTDGRNKVQVVSTGPVPQMFRAGQGVVVEGALGADGRFHSDTLLVKHDGEYRAPTSAQMSGGG
jgi:cytochrome c-type biogenesis protein CcmE